MQKTTILTFHKKSAKIDIMMSIRRIYGNQEENINLDGDVFQTVRFHNDVSVDVAVDGSLTGRCYFSRNPISTGQYNLKGIIMTLYTEKNASYKDGKNYFISFENEWVEQVNAACSEILTDEIDPEIEKKKQRLRDEAEFIKNAEKKGRILPIAELRAKRKEYQEGMLEGGEGYNPYDDYVNKEYAEHFKSIHPELF